MPDPFVTLARRLAPGADLVRTWALTGGVSAHVHAVELAHPDGRIERLVVRRHGALAKGHRPEVTADEFRLLKALWAAGLPVAAPRYLDAQGEIFGTPCFVSSFVEGTTEPPSDAPAKMATMLAAIHAFDVAALGIDTLPQRVDPSDDGGDGQPARRTPLQRRALLHGDFWPGNLLWRDGGEIVAVLDWEDAAIGDPLSDVAGCRQELSWRLGADAMDAFTRAYAEHTPVDPRDLAVWEVYVATAAITQMGAWGLPPEQEAAMRRSSAGFLARARAVLQT